MSAKSTVFLTFFQNLQEKVSGDLFSTNFDMDLAPADVNFLKKLIFLHFLGASRIAGRICGKRN